MFSQNTGLIPHTGHILRIPLTVPIRTQATILTARMNLMCRTLPMSLAELLLGTPPVLQPLPATPPVPRLLPAHPQ